MRYITELFIGSVVFYVCQALPARQFKCGTYVPSAYRNVSDYHGLFPLITKLFSTSKSTVPFTHIFTYGVYLFKEPFKSLS